MITALLRMHNDIALNLDQGRATALLLELSAAFDTIDHSNLFELLSRSFGIGGMAMLWLRSYLADRTQVIEINNLFLDPKGLYFGVAQRAVFGPVLFTLYTRPLNKLACHSQIQHHLYADDTQLYVSLSSTDAAQQLQKLKLYADEIFLWMTRTRQNF